MKHADDLDLTFDILYTLCRIGLLMSVDHACLSICSRVINLTSKVQKAQSQNKEEENTVSQALLTWKKSFRATPYVCCL